jgi:sulfur carrier protein
VTITVNGQPREVPDGLTLADLVGDHANGRGGRTTKGLAAAVDGAVAPRSTWAEVVLHDGAVVEVLTAVQGG